MSSLPRRLYGAVGVIRRNGGTETGWTLHVHPEVLADYLTGLDYRPEPLGRPETLLGFPVVVDPTLPEDGVLLRIEVVA